MEIPSNGFRLIRKNDVIAKMGIGKSSLYERINQGTFPPPVNLGSRSVAWPLHEVDIVIRALMADVPEQELKKMVCELVAIRKQKLQSIQ